MENSPKKELPKAFADFISNNAKEVEEVRYGKGDNEFVVRIDPLPSVAKRTEAIELAADLVFGLEPGVDGYIPSLLHFTQKYAVLLCFTDIDFAFDLNDIWALVNATPLYDDVVKKAGDKAVTDFIYELNELIDANKAARIHAVNINSVLERLTAMVNGISSQFKNIDMVKILKSFKNLPKDIKGEDFIKQIIIMAKGGV